MALLSRVYDLVVATKILATNRGPSALMPGARRFSIWLGRHPLVLFLPLHALLLGFHLDLLPVWGDEYATLDRSTRSPTEMLSSLRGNVHPPLYNLLVHYWLEIPLPCSQIAQARALSVVFTLLTLLLLHRSWLKHLDEHARWWFSALWLASPFLLLYARMARSYSLQLFLGCVTLHYGWRLIREPKSRLLLVSYALGGTLLLYTHYLPGAAVVTSVTLLLLWQLIRQRNPAFVVPLVLPNVLMTLALIAWLPPLADAIGRVARAEPHRLATNLPIEQAITLAYTFMAFNFGETLPVWGMVLGLVLLPTVLFLLWKAVHAAPGWLALVLPAAIIGYVGASQWVSFAFVPARLLFVFPFYLLLLLHGRARSRAVGNIACAGLLCVSLGSTGNYFRQESFLNKAYVIPFEEIGAYVAGHSRPDTTLLLLDHYNTNVESIRRDLPPGMHVVLLHDRRVLPQVMQLAQSGSVNTVWLVRNTRDVSPGKWIDALQTELSRDYETQRHSYMPYSSIDRAVMRAAGWQERPTHVIELLEMHRRNYDAGSA